MNKISGIIKSVILGFRVWIPSHVAPCSRMYYNIRVVEWYGAAAHVTDVVRCIGV